MWDIGKFICQKCGEFEPKPILLTYPLSAICPKCGFMVQEKKEKKKDNKK